MRRGIALNFESEGSDYCGSLLRGCFSDRLGILGVSFGSVLIASKHMQSRQRSHDKLGVLCLAKVFRSVFGELLNFGVSRFMSTYGKNPNVQSLVLLSCSEAPKPLNDKKGANIAAARARQGSKHTDKTNPWTKTA